MELIVSDNIQEKLGKGQLAVLTYVVTVAESTEEFLSYFDQVVTSLTTYTMEDIVKLPHLADTRTAYKKLGNSPSKHRNAAEAMLRRIVKGKGLYHINTIVDINNLMSVTTGFSIGSYLTDQSQGKIRLDVVEEDTYYEGIGKDLVNIKHLPVLFDDIGPFGSPTSDSQRAMVKPGRHEIMSIIYSFSDEDLMPYIEQYQALLTKYSDATSCEYQIIRYGN